MNRKLETILKDYHQMVFERNALQHQLANFKGITAEEVICLLMNALVSSP